MSRKKLKTNPSPMKKYFFPILLGLAGLSLILRLLMCAEVIPTDSFTTNPPAATDMATYQMISDRILHGDFPSEFVYQPFYYSVFLPAVKFLIRSNAWAPAAAQSLCAAIIVYLCGLCAAMLRGRKYGLFAAALASFSTMLFFYVPYALIEIQQCLWFTLLFYLTLLGMRKNRIWQWCMAGLVLGAAILSRGNAWCFLPPVLLALWYGKCRTGKNWKATALRAALFIVFVLLPQLPFCIVNTIATKSLSGPALAGPTVLALGNNPEAAPGGLTYPKTYTVWMNQEKTQSIPSRILNWANREPGAFLEFQIRKFLLFFESVEIPNNLSRQVNATKSRILPVFGIIPTGWIVFLCLFGFFAEIKQLRGRKERQILYLFILFYAMATAAFYILARFRVPALGLFCIGAGLLPLGTWRKLKQKQMKVIYRKEGIAIFAAAVFVFLFGPTYRGGYESGMMKRLRPAGVSLSLPDGSLEMLDNGPDFLEAWYPVKLEEGLTIEKTFAARPELRKLRTAEFEFQILTESPVNFSLLINDLEFTPDVEQDFRDWKLLSFTTPACPIPQNRKFRFQFRNVSSDSNAYILMDSRRDYGRTLLNGKPAKSEAVIRMTAKP